MGCRGRQNTELEASPVYKNSGTVRATQRNTVSKNQTITKKGQQTGYILCFRFSTVLLQGHASTETALFGVQSLSWGLLTMKLALNFVLLPNTKSTSVI